MSSMDFDSIAISGGSIKGFSVIGLLYGLQKKGLDINSIHTFCGVSSGSIICLLTLLKFEPIDIIKRVISGKLFDKLANSVNMSNVWSGSGIFDFELIHSFLLSMILEKYGYIPTMKDVRENFKKRFVAVSYNETKSQAEIFDSDNEEYDKLSVLVVIRASSNIPWLFSDFSINGCNFIDGALIDNFPIHLVDKSGKKVLGIVIEENTVGSTSNSTLNKILSRMKAPIKSIVDIRILGATPRCKIVSIDIPKFEVYNLNVSNSQILDLVSEGVRISKNVEEIWKSRHVKKD